MINHTPTLHLPTHGSCVLLASHAHRVGRPSSQPPPPSKLSLFLFRAQRNGSFHMTGQLQAHATDVHSVYIFATPPQFFHALALPLTSPTSFFDASVTKSPLLEHPFFYEVTFPPILLRKVRQDQGEPWYLTLHLKIDLSQFPRSNNIRLAVPDIQLPSKISVKIQRKR